MSYDDIAGQIMAHAFHDELEKIATGLSALAVGGAITAAKATRTGAKRAGTRAQVARIRRMAATKATRTGSPRAAEVRDVAAMHGGGGSSPLKGAYIKRGRNISPSWEGADAMGAVAEPTRKKGFLGIGRGGRFTGWKPSKREVGGMMPGYRGGGQTYTPKYKKPDW